MGTLLNPLINPPLLASPVKRNPQARSRSQSPARQNYRELDPLLRSLSPTTTLKAFTTDMQMTASATTSERALGTSAAQACLDLRSWTRELESWAWSDTFDKLEPSEKTSLTSEDKKEDTGTEYWGCLPAKRVVAYECRISEIIIQRDKIDVEELKSYALSQHNNSQSGRTSRNDSIADFGPTQPDFRRLDDCTALITATILQALPFFSRLNGLLDTWNIRLSILRAVPNYLSDLKQLGLDLDEAWTAIGQSRPSTAKQTIAASTELNRGGMQKIKSKIEQQVQSLGSRLDSFLDTLEGRLETVPEAWIEEFETLETAYGDWVVDAERKVLKSEWQASHGPSLAKKFQQKEASHTRNISYHSLSHFEEDHGRDEDAVATPSSKPAGSTDVILPAELSAGDNESLVSPFKQSEIHLSTSDTPLKSLLAVDASTETSRDPSPKRTRHVPIDINGLRSEYATPADIIPGDDSQPTVSITEPEAATQVESAPEPAPLTVKQRTNAFLNANIEKSNSLQKQSKTPVRSFEHASNAFTRLFKKENMKDENTRGDPKIVRSSSTESKIGKLNRTGSNRVHQDGPLMSMVRKQTPSPKRTPKAIAERRLTVGRGDSPTVRPGSPLRRPVPTRDLTKSDDSIGNRGERKSRVLNAVAAVGTLHHNSPPKFPPPDRSLPPYPPRSSSLPPDTPEKGTHKPARGNSVMVGKSRKEALNALSNGRMSATDPFKSKDQESQQSASESGGDTIDAWSRSVETALRSSVSGNQYLSSDIASPLSSHPPDHKTKSTANAGAGVSPNIQEMTKSPMSDEFDISEGEIHQANAVEYSVIESSPARSQTDTPTQQRPSSSPTTKLKVVTSPGFLDPHTGTPRRTIIKRASCASIEVHPRSQLKSIDVGPRTPGSARSLSMSMSKSAPQTPIEASSRLSLSPFEPLPSHSLLSDVKEQSGPHDAVVNPTSLASKSKLPVSTSPPRKGTKDFGNLVGLSSPGSPASENGDTKTERQAAPMLNITKKRQSGIPSFVGRPSLTNTSPKRATHAPIIPEDSFDRHVSQVLDNMSATRIRFRAMNRPETPVSAFRQEARASLPPGGAPRARPRVSSASSYAGSVNAGGITIMPAEASPKKTAGTVDPVKLYHLKTEGRDEPIKLFVRLVGEGERVMVRVGGGWADLADYLKKYAEHHTSRTVSGSGPPLEVMNAEANGAGSTNGIQRISMAGDGRKVSTGTWDAMSSTSSLRALRGMSPTPSTPTAALARLENNFSDNAEDFLGFPAEDTPPEKIAGPSSGIDSTPVPDSDDMPTPQQLSGAAPTAFNTPSRPPTSASNKSFSRLIGSNSHPATPETVSLSGPVPSPAQNKPKTPAEEALDQRKARWVEGMIEQARANAEKGKTVVVTEDNTPGEGSGSKKKGLFREIGKIGGTRRVIFRSSAAPL